MNSSRDRYHSVIDVITTVPQLTKEIDDKLGKDGLGCPDDLVKILTKLKKNGKIKGQFSKEGNGWEWWK